MKRPHTDGLDIHLSPLVHRFAGLPHSATGLGISELDNKRLRHGATSMQGMTIVLFVPKSQWPLLLLLPLFSKSASVSEVVGLCACARVQCVLRPGESAHGRDLKQKGADARAHSMLKAMPELSSYSLRNCFVEYFLQHKILQRVKTSLFG